MNSHCHYVIWSRRPTFFLSAILAVFMSFAFSPIIFQPARVVAQDSLEVEAGSGEENAPAKTVSQSEEKTLEQVETDKSPETKQTEQEEAEKQSESKLPVSPLLDPDQKIDAVPPWEVDKKKSETFLPDKNVTVRELLRNIDEGEMEHLYDYDPVESEMLLLIKILYRMINFPHEDMDRFISESADVLVNNIVDDPKTQRLKIVRLRGRAKKARKISLVTDIAQLFPLVDAARKPIYFDHYYQVEVEMDQDTSAIVCVRDIPQPWKTTIAQEALPADANLDEPVTFDGMFLKINSPRKQPTVLLFAAQRMRWHPDSKTIPIVNDGLLSLAKNGFDVGLMDDGKSRNRKMINDVDSRCLIELIAAANRLKPADVTQHPFDLVKLLTESGEHFGQSYQLEIDVRRITEVKIAEHFQHGELNLKQYYQLDGMVNTPVEIVDEKLGRYGKRFPVSVCVPTLPAGMEVGSDRLYQVTMPSFFFKIWPYRSPLTEQKGKDLEQHSPLMIGLEPEVESVSSGVSQTFNIAMTIIALLVFGFIWFGFWRLNRQSLPTRSRFRVGSDQRSGERESEDSTATNKPNVDFPKIDV